MYIPGTTYLHILLHCTLYLIAHLTPYFISLFVSYLILTIFVYIYTLSCFLFHSFLLLLCYFFYFIIMFYFSFLHFPLSGPVPTNISLPIIPCMIVYVTNNKEPWSCGNQTLNCGFKPPFMVRTWQTLHVFEFFTLFQSLFLNKIINIFIIYILTSDIVSNHETGLCCLTLMTCIFSTVCRAGCNINNNICFYLLEMHIWQ